MTTVSLNSALSGLKAAQKALDVVSNNIANASTEGYTRKILPQKTLIIQGEGRGVVPESVLRNVDKVLMRDLFTQIGVSENRSVVQKYLGRIQDFHGSSEARLSLASQVSNLAQSFTELSGDPDNSLSLNRTLTAAQQLASKFNDFSTMLTQMRNQTESEIVDNVSIVNQSLDSIADLNIRISSLRGSGKSSADLEDQRDLAIRAVSKYIQISSFDSDNGKIVVMTRQGQVLADESARQISFTKSNILPTSYYPGGGIDGLFIDSLEITNVGLGGAIGALIDLRDETLPTYQAQVDELAQKLAFRLDQQGLRLFTDTGGNVPANVADPGAVGYVGFAAQIQVNNQIVADPTLLRSGTNGNTVLPGSNEIIRKVAEFAFGAHAYIEARGTADISAGGLFGVLGLQQYNEMIGNTAVTTYTPSLDAHPDIAGGSQFMLTIGVVPSVITINPGDTALDLANNINAATGFSCASINGLGQLVLNAAASIGIADISLGAAGIAALGFSFGGQAPQDPSFTVRVGTQLPVTVSIALGDTQADLLASLNLIDGLSATLGPGGVLVLTPTEGGDLTITDGVGRPLAAMGVTLSNIAHTSFRQNNLGPDQALSTGLLANATLEEFGRSVITAESEDARVVESQAQKETSFLNTLDKRNSDFSGVNIDQELAEMIRIQANYAAAAKMISASERMLDDLMEAFL